MLLFKFSVSALRERFLASQLPSLSTMIRPQVTYRIGSSATGAGGSDNVTNKSAPTSSNTARATEVCKAIPRIPHHRLCKLSAVP